MYKYKQYNKNLISSGIIFLCLAGSDTPRKTQIHSVFSSAEDEECSALSAFTLMVNLLIR